LQILILEGGFQVNIAIWIAIGVALFCSLGAINKKDKKK
jgi:hypothetical protein